MKLQCRVLEGGGDPETTEGQHREGPDGLAEKSRRMSSPWPRPTCFPPASCPHFIFLQEPRAFVWCSSNREWMNGVCVQVGCHVPTVYSPSRIFWVYLQWRSRWASLGFISGLPLPVSLNSPLSPLPIFRRQLGLVEVMCVWRQTAVHSNRTLSRIAVWPQIYSWTSLILTFPWVSSEAVNLSFMGLGGEINDKRHMKCLRTVLREDPFLFLLPPKNSLLIHCWAWPWKTSLELSWAGVIKNIDSKILI